MDLEAVTSVSATQSQLMHPQGLQAFVRLIQFTDIHLKSDPEGRILDYSPDAGLRQVLHSIESDQQPADAFVLTGDLADDASASAYSRLRMMLETLGKPVFVLPGNHDLPAQMQTSLLCPHIQMTEEHELGDWTLLFLDSRIPGQDHGRISGKDLSKVDDFLSQHSRKPCLLAVHHSAFAECYSKGCHLENAEDLLALAARHENLKLVMSGHTHWSVERSHGGTRFLSTPSTFLHVVHPSHAQAGVADTGMQDHVYRNVGAYRVFELFVDGSFTTAVHELEIGVS